MSGFVAGFIVATVICTVTGFTLFGDERETPVLPATKGNTELTSFALSVVEDIKNGDFQALSQVAHPELGVLFSPSATITLSTNKCFQGEQIAAFGTDTTLYVWGVLTGSGEPIELTVADYFAQFVFDRDYSAAPVIGVNRIIRSGNALENMTELLPDVKFIDFHVPGTEKESTEDYDWGSLRLGFEEYDGFLWLTVILHSGWAE